MGRGDELDPARGRGPVDLELGDLFLEHGLLVDQRSDLGGGAGPPALE